VIVQFLNSRLHILEFLLVQIDELKVHLKLLLALKQVLNIRLGIWSCLLHLSLNDDLKNFLKLLKWARVLLIYILGNVLQIGLVLRIGILELTEYGLLAELKHG